MKGKARILKTGAVLLLLGGLLLTLPAERAEQSRPAPPAFTSPAPRRLLVVLPHPDDESLAATTMIRRTLQEGGEVRVALMTNGDGYRGAAAKVFHVDPPRPQHLYRLGLMRQKELHNALKRLGVPEHHAVLLGYPDAGLHHLWNDHWNSSHPYRGLNGQTSVTYRESFHKGSPYCGQAIVSDLCTLLCDFQPTDVLYPDPHDVHRDHAATNAFLQYALGSLERPPREWNYLIHYPHFPVPRRYQPNATLFEPGVLHDIGVAWYALPLSKEEQERKHAAILAHRSQVLMMKDLLESFVRTDELFAQYPQALLEEGRWQTIDRDATGDFLIGSKGGSTDIRALSCRLEANSITFRLDLEGFLQNSYDYTLHLRFPGQNDKANRLDISFQNGNLTVMPPSPHSEEIKRHSLIAVDEQQIRFTLPVALLPHTGCWMIAADIREHAASSHPLDSTAWRRLNLP
jgi:LmbE family N-acetylglucosaminyl deacetylase